MHRVLRPGVTKLAQYHSPGTSALVEGVRDSGGTIFGVVTSYTNPLPWLMLANTLEYWGSWALKVIRVLTDPGKMFAEGTQNFQPFLTSNPVARGTRLSQRYVSSGLMVILLAMKFNPPVGNASRTNACDFLRIGWNAGALSTTRLHILYQECS